MKFKVYFKPVIVEAKDIYEVERRIDDGELFNAIVSDVIEEVEA